MKIKSMLLLLLMAAFNFSYLLGCSKIDSEIAKETKAYVSNFAYREASKAYAGKFYEIKHERINLFEETPDHFEFIVEGQIYIYTSKGISGFSINKKDSNFTARYQYIANVLSYKNSMATSKYKLLDYKQWDF